MTISFITYKRSEKQPAFVWNLKIKDFKIEFKSTKKVIQRYANKVFIIKNDSSIVLFIFVTKQTRERTKSLSLFIAVISGSQNTSGKANKK